MKKKIILFFLILMSIGFTGCWSYKDIDDMRLVGCMAIDYDQQKDEYITTIEIIDPASKKKQQMGGELYVSRGKTPFDGVRDVIMKAGRNLYWGHTKTMIISQEIAKNKIIPIVDLIYRDAEFRSDAHIIVSKEKTAQEILRKSTEQHIQPIRGYHLQDVLESEEHIEKYHGVDLWKYLKKLYADGVSPVLPAIYNREEEGKVYPIISGMAVFKGKKLVGWLDEDEAKAFAWVVDEDDVGASIIVVRGKLKEEPVKISLEVLGNQTKLKPILIANKIVMQINVETGMRLEEIAGTEDFISKKGRSILEKDTEKFIQKEIEELIKRVQKKYHSDIFGFSTSIKKEMPELWRKIKPNWESFFTNMEVDVNVKVTIEGSALQQKPIKISE
ncbi:MAG: Ger(x)C family spore germination protein [Marinisporobacter sp.]|jgi:spore germination protein KC|nr:Ger(x)C family spore germination protein [Marinisporobacter sp.]